MGRFVWMVVFVLVGCSETSGGGTGGDGGDGGSGPVTVELLLVDPSETDPAIDNPIGGGHVVYVPSVSMRPELFVQFVGGTAVPETAIAALNQEWLGPFIAQHMKVIVPQYANVQRISPVCVTDPDPDCYEKLRLERIYGTDEGPHEDVSPPNGIIHRLVKLLEWLDAEQPTIGWGDYLEAGQPRWDRITLAGHSDGAGMAALIARDHGVGRVLLFAGPSDKPLGETADYLTDPKVTPIDRHFGFIHVEEGPLFTHANWKNMGLPGPPILIEESEPPYSGSHFLETNADVPPGKAHSSVIGIVPSFTFEETWLYMCCSELP